MSRHRYTFNDDWQDEPKIFWPFLLLAIASALVLAQFAFDVWAIIKLSH